MKLANNKIERKKNTKGKGVNTSPYIVKVVCNGDTTVIM